MATKLVKSIRDTRAEEGKELRQTWVKASNIECVPLRFGDLKAGDNFIPMPLPGHSGGYRDLAGTSYLFKKIRPMARNSCGRPLEKNAIRLFDGDEDYFPESTLVISVV